MIMSPSDIISKNRQLLLQQDRDKNFVDGLHHIKDSTNHLEDCMKFLVEDIACVSLIEEGFKIEYNSEGDSNDIGYLVLDELRFSSVCDSDSRQSEQRLLCAYLDYLSGF